MTIQLVSTKTGLTCAALLFVAACNTQTSTGTTNTPATAAATASVGGINKPKLEALQAQQDFTNTVIANLPVAGSATYNGFAQIIGDGTVVTQTEIVGEAALTVGFAGGGSMTGTLSNFDDPTATYTGTLDVTGGTFSDAAGVRTVRSNVAGTITRNSGEAIAVAGDISGSFRGTTGQHLVGFDNINVTSGGSTAAANISLNASQP